MAGGQCALASLPPFSTTRLYQAGNSVGDSNFAAPITSDITSPHSGQGFLGVAVNNSGAVYVHAALAATPPPPDPGTIFQDNNHAILFSGLALPAPFLFGGAGYDGYATVAGGVTVPSADYTYDEGFWTALNNHGTGAFDLRLVATGTNLVAPTTGVYFNKTAMPIKEGNVITAAGVAPGTVFGPLGPDRIARYQNSAALTSTVQLNDNNVFLIACMIVESGQSKSAILKVAVDSAGAVMSETLVAKAGGLVGSGPDTWATLSTTPNTCAINNSGQVIFSGTTTGGVNGIYLTSGTGGQFVAVTGGPAPTGGTWTSLVGAPVDVNNAGHFAFRAPMQSNGLWTESVDAGEGFGSGNGGGPPLTAQNTTGGGALNQINGTLSNDQDVDLYLITIGDPTLSVQTPFSATTVPNPGAGFAGANFDTVLYLYQYNGFLNGYGVPQGVGRCDDAAAGVVQSTLTTSSLPTSHTPGKQYLLGVSTPKARSWSADNGFNEETWLAEPGRIAVGSTTGMAFWVDAANGQIGRSSLSSATLLSPLPVANPPLLASATAQSSITVLGDAIATYDAGVNSKVFFLSTGNSSAIRSCDTSGAGIADVVTNASNTMDLAVDSVNARLYWSTFQRFPAHGRINTSDLSGAGNTTIVDAGTHVISALAVDTLGTGMLYWYDATVGAIQRSDLTGTYNIVSDTWEYDGTNWTKRITAATPPARYLSAMAYDSARGKIVLFGGEDSNGNFLSDTWEYDGTNWTRRTTAATPPARYSSAMAYDSARGRVVLFGGEGSNVNFLSDTWEYDGTNWTQRTTVTIPPLRRGHAMAYDSATGTVVLFGGDSISGTGFGIQLSDTWEYNGTNWAQRTTVTTPPERSAHSMAYDSASGKIVLFGGTGSVVGGIFASDTWEYDGTNWTQQSTATTPPGRTGSAMAYDAATGKVVLFGGYNGGNLSDTWEYDGTNWTQRSTAATPGKWSAGNMAYDIATGKVVLFGGTSNAYTVLAAADVRSMTVDSVGRRLYYSSNSGNAIGVIDISGTPTALSNLAAPTAPMGVAFDSTAGNVYWSAPLARMLQRSSVSSPSVQSWTSIGPDVGERPAYGPGSLATFQSFVRNGTAGSTALPYSIKLTGATYFTPLVMICKDNTTKVVQTNDAPASTGGRPLADVGTPTGPVRISDRGLVAWRGRWRDVTNTRVTGVFLNTDKIVDDNTVPTDNGTAIGSVDGLSGSLDMSSSGQYLAASSYFPGLNWGAVPVAYNAFVVSFASVPGCAADYNQDGSLSVQDIFDFLNGWFGGSLTADFNADGQLQVQDIFDFLNSWFAGC